MEREGTRKTGWTWFQATQWLSPEQAAFLTHLAIIQMDALWTVAKHRYLGEPRPERLQLVSGEALDAVRSFTRSGPLRSFRRTVATERPPGPDAVGDTSDDGPPSSDEPV